MGYLICFHFARMKFGRKLAQSAHPAFRNYYIAYKDLKEAIKLITGEEAVVGDEIVGSAVLERLQRSTTERAQGGISRTPESQFQELLDHELNKINNFSNVHFSALMEEIREIVYRLTHGLGLEDHPVLALREEIVAFDEYIRLNFSGFRKALKKFDKWNKSDSSNWFLQRVVRSDFMLIQIDKLLHGLSLIEAIKARRFNNVNACRIDSLEMLTKPTSFKRTKFFVSPEDLVEIEVDILQHSTPIYAFPMTQTVPRDITELVERYRTGRSGLTGQSPGDICFTESVIIFDDSDLTQYSARRSKRVNVGIPGGYARPIYSVRWNQYQHKEGKCCLVLESHPKYETEGAMHAVELRQQNIADVISGKLSIGNLIVSESLRDDSVTREFLSDFEEMIQQGSKPTSMFNYRRSLFQADQVYLAVDKDIKFVDVKSLHVRSLFELPAMQFQAILTQRTLTVWLPKTSESQPSFLQEIVGKPAVSEVIGFSKAIHAEAVLHVVTEVDRPVRVGLPQWFVHTIAGMDNKELKFTSAVAEEDMLASPALSPSAETAGKFDVLPVAQASSRLLIHDIVSAKEPKQAPQSMVSSGGKERRPVVAPSPLLPSTTPLIGTELDTPLLDRKGDRRRKKSSKSLFDQIKYILFGSIVPEVPEPVSRIEPKTLLANERTFLNWSYLSFVLAAVAITLASVDASARLEASLLTFAAVISLGWSLNVYRLRVIALRNMKALDTLMVSSNGATLVCLMVAFALFLTWLGRFRQYINSVS